MPDSAATAYLRVIEQIPDAAMKALRVTREGEERPRTRRHVDFRELSWPARCTAHFSKVTSI
jgi:hypothetical protein